MRRGLVVIIGSALAVVIITLGFGGHAPTNSQTTIEQHPEHSGAMIASSSEQPPILKTQKDKVNYAIGVNLIGSFKQQGIDIDLDLVIRGMKDTLSGKKLLMTESEIRKSIMVYQGEVRRMQAEARAMAAQSNKEKGEAFLADNRRKEGVVALPSGLQYRILKTGEGKKPTDADTVECHYRGTLIDGTEFDSSYQTNRPATLKITNVIAGLREALKLMPVGSKWRVFIPSQLAFGTRDVSGPIEPNETLIYEVELLAIK